jgi:cell wall-associated NlpC family hydrolase
MIPYVDLLGKPFKYGGRGPDYYDCFGLAKELYFRLGKTLPDITSTADFEEIEKKIEAAEKYYCLIDKPVEYCLVTFRLTPRFVSHIGVVLPNLYQFIHITRNTSITIERLDSLQWKKKIANYLLPI